MSNIINAFINIANNYSTLIEDITDGNNRANNMGEALEIYIKDAFANTFTEENKQLKKKNIEKFFLMKGQKLEFLTWF